MANKSLRWGILGCARISRRGLIPGINESTTGTLAAIGSRDLATAQAWASEFAIPKAYGSYQAVLDDPEIDAIYIPLPNELHKPWIIAAADKGKHILCEKPLTIDGPEAIAIREYCREKGVLLMEAFMWRHQPRTLKLVEMVRDGAIGTLRLIRASFSFPMEGDDWRLDPARGGGALWDVGCYGVSTARLFAGAEPVNARAVARFGPTGVDLSLSAALEFPSSVLAVIDCSFEQPFRCHYELVGSAGTISVPDAYLPPAEAAPLAVYRPMGKPAFLQNGEGVDLLEFPSTNQYAAMVDCFGRSVAAGALERPAEDGVGQMQLLDRILNSARGG